MKVGFRTLKTAIGAAISIFLAQLFQLDFYVSAGILTILCIQPTKKSSIIHSINRILACLIGIAYSFVLFSLLGYEAYTIGVLLLLFIPLLVKLKLQSGFISSVVIILHIYTIESFTLEIFINELLIIFIGIGIALLLNLYMPNVERQLKEYQCKIEDTFSIIFMEFAKYLENGDSSWSGRELLEAESYIKHAKELAIKDIENHLRKPKESYYHYFTMREKQFEILERMLPIISSLDEQVEQRHAISDFFSFISKIIHPKDTVSYSLQKLNHLREEIRQDSLPKTREEFEARAALYHLITELEQYLVIKEQSFQRINKTFQVEA